MTSLEGKVALVTGAGRGLGLAMARGLLERGARVAMADRDALGAAVSDLDALALAGDVSNADDAERMFEETFAAFGAIHVLVNNAGLGPQRFRDTGRSDGSKVWDVDLADWLLYLDANVTGHFVMTKAAIPYMRAQNWGRIVNVTTSFETMIDPANGAYGPSKAAAEALASMIAGGLDIASGVTCNVLIPGGPADTRMISATGIYADRSKLIRPEVMLPPLLHLVSEQGGDVNGRRIRAALWDPGRSSGENLERAGAPIAWPQLGGQAIHPQGDPRGKPGRRKAFEIMTDRPLEGRTAMITGAGRGLGLAMAQGLAAHGVKIVIVDLKYDELVAALEAVEEAGGDECAMAVDLDVTDDERAPAAVESAIKTFGGLDILINNAALGPQHVNKDSTNDFVNRPPKFWHVDPERWVQTLAINAYGPQLMSALVAPHLIERGWGRIINVTTSLDTMYLRGCGSYGPSKAALEANTRIMAHDLAGTGVTANVLIPGGPANTRMIPEETGFDRSELIQPTAMQAPVCWLCSEDADGINGMRFVAALWNENLPRDERIAAAGAPVAWPQIGSPSVRPGSWEHEEP